MVHAGKEDGVNYQDGSTQDCVMAASPRAPASNTGDCTISASFKEPVALSGRGTNLHSAMAPLDKVEHLTKDHSASLQDRTLASAPDVQPSPSQHELPRVGLGRPQGFRNGAEVIHKEPVPSVEIVFEVKGREKRFQFMSKPLGAEFSKRRTGPTKVSKVHAGSYASKLGVEVGWDVKSVDGEDVREKTFQQTQAAIIHAVMLLPATNPPVETAA